MKTLEEFLSEQGEHNIQTLAGYVHQYIEERWQPVLEENQEDILRIYDKAGEGAAYGTYAQRLFRPVQEQLKGAGFLSEPSFPGTLATSREWGPQEERERWMWSVVRPGQQAPMGTLVVRFFHDHTQFRIPHPPEILAVEATETSAIVEALSQTSAQFESGEE